jgi:hypothetical protein
MAKGIYRLPFSPHKVPHEMGKGPVMQITGPHFLDGHRHPWLHRGINVSGYNTRLPPRFFAHIRAKLLPAHPRSGLNRAPRTE